MWVFIFQRSDKEELARETGEEHMVSPPCLWVVCGEVLHRTLFGSFSLPTVPQISPLSDAWCGADFLIPFPAGALC